jgi:hypothetical protein
MSALGKAAIVGFLLGSVILAAQADDVSRGARSWWGAAAGALLFGLAAGAVSLVWFIPLL